MRSGSWYDLRRRMVIIVGSLPFWVNDTFHRNVINWNPTGYPLLILALQTVVKFRFPARSSAAETAALPRFRILRIIISLGQGYPISTYVKWLCFSPNLWMIWRSLSTELTALRVQLLTVNRITSSDLIPTTISYLLPQWIPAIFKLEGAWN